MPKTKKPIVNKLARALAKNQREQMLKEQKKAAKPGVSIKRPKEKLDLNKFKKKPKPPAYTGNRQSLGSASRKQTVAILFATGKIKKK